MSGIAEDTTIEQDLQTREDGSGLGGADSLMGAIDTMWEGPEADTQKEDKVDEVVDDKVVSKEVKPIQKSADDGSPIKGSKARQEFDNLKRLKDQHERDAFNWKSKYEDLQKKSAEPHPELVNLKAERETLQKELQTLRAKADELGKVVALKAIEETDDYKAKVTTPRMESSKNFWGIVKANELSQEAMAKISAIPDKWARRKELHKALQEADALHVENDLNSTIDQFYSTHDTERSLRQEAEGNKDFVTKAQQEKEAKGRLERQEQWSGAYKELADAMANKDGSSVDKSGVFKQLLSVEGVEPLFKGILEKASKFDSESFDKQAPKAKQFTNITSHAFLPVVRHLLAELARRDDAARKRNSAEPGHGRGSQGGREEDGGDDMISFLGKNFVGQ